MMMKQLFPLFMLLIAFIMGAGSVNAQQRIDKQRLTREQLAEVQAKHIAKEMNLDEATTQKYVKTYCDYQQEIWALGPRSGKSKRSSAGQMNDVETDKAIKERFEMSQKILNIREKYYGKYREFLTPMQIKRAYGLEKKMMNRLSASQRKSRMNRNK